MEVKEKIKKTIQKHTENGHSVNGSTVINKRIPVLKTYKLYINGQFPRTESGRYYKLANRDGKVIANVTTYRDWETDRKSTRLNSSHRSLSRMPSSA